MGGDHGLSQLGPNILPVVRSELLSCDNSLRNTFDAWALLNRDASNFPITYGSDRNGESCRQLAASSYEARCGINWMIFSKLWKTNLGHALTITRFVFPSQHHVLTQGVSNNTL